MVADRDFKRATVSGLSWSVLEKIIVTGLNFLITIILARLLLPSDFGLLAMVTVITGFASVFYNFGFGNLIMYKQDISNNELSTLFWFIVFMGVFMGVLLLALSGLIADFYGNRKLTAIAQVISLQFFIGSISVVSKSLMYKKMLFKRITLIELASIILSSILAVLLAFFNFGVWSLVAKIIAAAFISTSLFWFSNKWRPRLYFSTSDLFRNLSYGLNVAGNNSITYWGRNIDNLMIGKMIGEAALGVYSKAYTLMMLPVTNIGYMVRRIMLPSFASIQEDKQKVKRVYLTLTQLICFIGFPLIVIISALSRPLVFVVYGARWEALVVPLQLVTLSAIPQLILMLNGSIYMAMGVPKIPFRINLVFIPFTALAFYIGLKVNGLNGLIIGYLLSWALFFYPIFHFAAKQIDLSFTEQVKNIGGILFLTILQYLFAYLLTQLISSNIIVLSIGLVVVALSSLIYAELFKLSSYFEFKQTIIKTFKR